MFFAAVAQFITLNRTNKKHILNACRAKAGETPKALSLVVKVVGVISFVLGLLGTLLWGYGDWAICSWQDNCGVNDPDGNIEDVAPLPSHVEPHRLRERQRVTEKMAVSTKKAGAHPEQ